jgi:hypothetical protein
MSWLEAPTTGIVVGIVATIITFLGFIISALTWLRPRHPKTPPPTELPAIYTVSLKRLSEGDFAAGLTAVGQKYIPIPEDLAITRALRQKQDVLIIGRPGIGKSHSAIHSIKTFRMWYHYLARWRIIIPSKKLIHYSDFLRVKRMRYIIMLDDINEYIDEIEGGESIFDLITSVKRQSKAAIVVATVRETFPEAQSILRDTKILSFFTRIQLSDWPVDRGRRLAAEVGKPMDFWDGTPLSIVQPSHRMFLLYRVAPYEQQSLLRELKFLSEYRLKNVQREVVRNLYEAGIFGSDVAFDTAVTELCNKGFLKLGSDLISAYTAVRLIRE